MITIPGIKTHGRVGYYERKGIYSIEEVLPHVTDGSNVYVEFDGDPIRMNSPRYILFQTNVVCVRCGLTGLFFAKERAVYWDRPTGRYWPTSLHYHFNLYGLNQNGHEVMLTKDHIVPRAHGGADEQSNYQTMCAPCNGRKRDRLPHETDEEFAARRAREKDAEKQRHAELSRHGVYTPRETTE